MDRRHLIKSTATAAPFALAGASASSAAADAANSAGDPVAALTEDLNPSIRKFREAALARLQPSERDLQHGLELHADSVVFDSYGFSPRAAMDGEAVAVAASEGATATELDDLREGMPMTRCVDDETERAEYLDAWRASGVTCVFQNAGQEGQDPMRMLKRLARYTYVTDNLSDHVEKVTAPDEVGAVKAAGKHSLCFTTNGVPLLQRGDSAPEELSYVEIFRQLGIRMMHLTYQRRNMIGDGCGEKSDAGLSDFGRAAIVELNRQGIIPDCAHSGWRTSLEAAQVSEKPVVASHSTAAAIHPHIRSKPDEVIEAIVDTGGFIGICCISRYLRGEGDIGALLDHIDHVAGKFGSDHVAIGVDRAYTSQRTAEERRKAARAALGRKRRKPLRMLWPEDDYRTEAEAADSIAWTNWPLFTVGLVQRGYSDEDIRKILGGNVLRVLRESA